MCCDLSNIDADATVLRAPQTVAIQELRGLAETDPQASIEAALAAFDSQRRISEAESRYHLSLSEYAVATKNVHFEKGTLLQFANLLIVDNPVVMPPSISDTAITDGADKVISQPRAEALTMSRE